MQIVATTDDVLVRGGTAGQASSGTRRVGWLVRSVLLYCALLPTLCAGEQDTQFLEALRERQLFQLAERHARQRLADRSLPPAEQAELTVELIRTLALHALHAPPAERPRRWAEARQAASDFLAVSPARPRAMLVRVQDALTLLAQGELARHEHEAGVLAPAAKEQALAALREGSSRLEELDKELTREIPLRRRVEPRDGSLSADELFSLHQHVRRQLARALRTRALLYEAGTEDRLSLLLSAAQVLEDLLRELPADEPLAAETQLDLAACKRLLGETEVARELLARLDQEPQPLATRRAARAERVRLELAAGRRAAAAELLNDAPPEASSPELDLARLELELDKLRTFSTEGDATDRRALESAIETLARQITQTHGAYWGRRADQLVASTVAKTGGGGASAAILSRAADSLYLKGEFDQAVAAYERAAAQAAESADPQAAFELRYKAALVQQRRGQHEDAARRLRELSLSLRTHEQAGQAHLLAAWNAAQAARKNADSLALYGEILAEHADVWPNGNSLPQNQLWLGRLRETEQRWSEAAAAYASVPPQSEHFPAALAGAAKAWKAAYRAQQAQGDVDRARLQAAVEHLKAVMDRGASSNDQPLGELERLAALTAAELLLDFGEDEQQHAEAILQGALARAGDAPDAWRGAATARLVVALSAQPEKRGEARRLLAEAGEAAPGQLLHMAEGLAGLVDQARPQERPAVATLLLDAVALLEPSRGQLDRAAQVRIDRLHTTGLAAAGRQQEAVALAAKLSRENPNSAELQESYASLLLEGNDRQRLEQGLGEWRKIAARSKPRTERWLRAKYHVALAQLKLGDVAGATTLLRYMLEAPPGLEGTAWKDRYNALLARCRAVDGGLREE